MSQFSVDGIPASSLSVTEKPADKFGQGDLKPGIQRSSRPDRADNRRILRIAEKDSDAVKSHQQSIRPMHPKMTGYVWLIGNSVPLGQ